MDKALPKSMDAHEFSPFMFTFSGNLCWLGKKFHNLGLRQAEPLWITPSVSMPLVARCHGVGTVIFIHGEIDTQSYSTFTVQIQVTSRFHAILHTVNNDWLPWCHANQFTLSHFRPGNAYQNE